MESRHHRPGSDGPDIGDPELYRELRAIAEALLPRGRPGETLQPTALVHEAWLKVQHLGPGAHVDAEPGRTRKRTYALAAKAMRSVLVDRARAKAAERRGGGAGRDTLTGVSTATEVHPADLLDLDLALAEFEAVDPARARIVELLFFGGLTASEAADVLGLTSRSVERGWAAARAWLHRRLGERDRSSA